MEYLFFPFYQRFRIVTLTGLHDNTKKGRIWMTNQIAQAERIPVRAGYLEGMKEAMVIKTMAHFCPIKIIWPGSCFLSLHSGV
ncbi:hypothetical protein DCMF_25805 [Candidatus Formimonas warabiya]|uniref:Uncharacterized protein n=1 Tax=Formimonas warabiya TaxID=1761012 RepID=A0A3G1KYZ0_FORW1|nr:hypothetical protein DCMF_25805 [Candidatus Formimonas warabiya]